ncbi:MAG: DUF1501 domain-containing protein [Gemmatimonas sp.]
MTHAIDRRSFLALAGAGLLLPLASNAWAATGAGPTRRLVVVFLRGAVDGLNVVVPHGDSAYYEARPSIAVPRATDGVIDLDGHFGLHPALASVEPLWREGRLAFVHAFGSPDPSRSHFDAQAMMETGTPGNPGAREGWLNRLAAALPGGPTASHAISVGPTTPRILAGPAPVTNIDAGPNAGRPIPIDRPAVTEAFARIYDGDDAMSRAFRQGQEQRKRILADLEQEMQAADNGAPSVNGFPAQAKRIASIIRRDAAIRVAFVALGGWDTHVNQGGAKGQLANHLQPLADGLATFVKELGNSFDDTVILVISEFGRTVRENGNGGTDHGHGNVMWAMGGPIAGGKVYGEWPGLAPDRLYQNRDLAVTSDFRTVIATIVERHMQLGDPALRAMFPEVPSAQAPYAAMLRA